MQEDDAGAWRLVEANSRFITDTEARYAMVELELLGVRWAMKKCHMYLFGLPNFTLVVDHLPLVSILDKQTLDCIDNARLQRLKVDTSPYNFTTVWKKGKDHRIPDALSRAPVNEPTAEDLDDEQELYHYVSLVLNDTVMQIETEVRDGTPDRTQVDPHLERIKAVASTDEEYQALLKALSEGTTLKGLPQNIQMYKNFLDEISQNDGILLYNQRLIIPRQLRKEILQTLHSSHQGIERTLRRARKAVFWPGLSADIKSTVAACQECNRYKPSLQKEPLESDPMPTRIFEHMAADYFEVDGKHYLAIVDRYSGWLELFRQPKAPTSESLIDNLIEMFCMTGCPTMLFTDGGKQFTAADTQNFLRNWGVSHRLSSPMYPQSNGLAESAVKALKLLLKKHKNKPRSQNFRLGLLELRNTPREGGKSPAEIVFGRQLRTLLPSHPYAFDKKWQTSQEEFDAKRAELHKKAAKAYNKSARELQPLKIGDNVLIQNAVTKEWDRVAIIVERWSRRRYLLKQPSGRTVIRNRRFLQKVKPPEEKPSTPPAAKPRKSNLVNPDAPRRTSQRVRFKPVRLDL